VRLNLDHTNPRADRSRAGPDATGSTSTTVSFPSSRRGGVVAGVVVPMDRCRCWLTSSGCPIEERSWLSECTTDSTVARHRRQRSSIIEEMEVVWWLWAHALSMSEFGQGGKEGYDQYNGAWRGSILTSFRRHTPTHTPTTFQSQRMHVILTSLKPHTFLHTRHEHVGLGTLRTPESEH
jgi:hypothetical protein